MKIPRVNVMNEETKAYWAGLFDGEGWIRVEVKEGVRSGTGVLIVGLGSTLLSIPSQMQNAFGGYVTSARISSKLSKKESSDWRATNEAALNFLRAIYPYMRVKKRQAALAFKFRKIMDQTLHTGDAHRIELFRDLAKQIACLNKGLPLVETVKGASRNSGKKSQSSNPD
jgi:hypothetical protein